MGEFNLIQRIKDYFPGNVTGNDDALILGIGDDAAVLQPEPGKQLVISVDTLNQGVHFSSTTSAEAIGHKALMVNLSDMAAMGARPRWMTLSLSLPDEDHQWLDAFCNSMAKVAETYGVVLVGGDTTRGSLSISIQIIGTIDGAILTRGGAMPGDKIVVSGCLGGAAMALANTQENIKPDAQCLKALDYPQARVVLGQSLSDLATACIDISDGLAADLGHILNASKVGAELQLAVLPHLSALAALDKHVRWQYQLSGGDDYELCFTLPESHWEKLPEIEASTGVPLTVVGTITEQPGLRCFDEEGSLFKPGRSGYEHFKAD